MKFLLDTHTFLWFIEDSPKLSATARRLIEEPSNERLFSIASVWEIAIKINVGRLNLSQPFEILIPQQLSLNSIDLLGIEIAHTAAITSLPLYHRDPFDRLLIAQAMVEQIPLVSVDTAFDAYPVTKLW